MCVTCDIPGGDGVASEVVDGGGITGKKTKTNNLLGSTPDESLLLLFSCWSSM